MSQGHLTPKQTRFVQEYLVDANGTRAAIRAGYSARTANEQASRLLANVSVRRALDMIMAERSQRTQVTQDRVVLESSRIAFADPRRAFNDDGTLKDVKDWPGDVAAAISSLEVSERIGDDGVRVITKKIRFWDKTSNLNLLARHLGMFTDKVDMKFSHVQALEELQQAADKARKESVKATPI